MYGSLFVYSREALPKNLVAVPIFHVLLLFHFGFGMHALFCLHPHTQGGKLSLPLFYRSPPFFATFQLVETAK